MVEKTNVNSPTVNATGPTPGISLKAACVRAAPFKPVNSPGYFNKVVIRTRPVMAQIITVSQKVPVEETSAWLTGFLVLAAAATMGALPNPDSLEKRPRAIP